MFQWGIDTVYQEDYFDLLYITEMGRRITYDPSTAVNELNTFHDRAVAAISGA